MAFNQSGGLSQVITDELYVLTRLNKRRLVILIIPLLKQTRISAQCIMLQCITARSLGSKEILLLQDLHLTNGLIKYQTILVVLDEADFLELVGISIVLVDEVILKS